MKGLLPLGAFFSVICVLGIWEDIDLENAHKAEDARVLAVRKMASKIVRNDGFTLLLPAINDYYRMPGYGGIEEGSGSVWLGELSVSKNCTLHDVTAWFDTGDKLTEKSDFTEYAFSPNDSMTVYFTDKRDLQDEWGDNPCLALLNGRDPS